MIQYQCKKRNEALIYKNHLRQKYKERIKMDKSQRRDSFGSKLGIIAAAAGSAIGLGNIWRFPYITGTYGGASFLIIYLVCIAIIGLPVMLAEFIIGRKAGRNAIGAFRKLTPGEPWVVVGWMGIAGAISILSFYSVVAGWCMDYIYKAITNSFVGQTPDQIGTMFNELITNPIRPVFWQLLFMILTALIVLSGIKEGIEKYSKILMPLLLIIIIILDIRAITLEGSVEGLRFLFQPDWMKVTPKAVFIALGHAFFTLSLGMGTMITYGSYINKKDNLGVSVLQVTFADTFIAILAGIAIFPAVFAFGINPSDGPGLVFVTLPNIFPQMPGGYIFGVLFFILLFVAALTSAISLVEVPVAYLSEETNIDRKKGTILTTIVISAVGVLCSLSQGPWDATFLGKSFFDLMDYLSANWLLPIGGFIISIFIGWRLSGKEVRKEIQEEGTKGSYTSVFLFVIRFLAPVAIALVFLNSLGILQFG